MSNLAIKKATRAAVKIKIFLAGPSGSGKTDGALALARNFAGPDARICVIDTERESASYYADRYEFDTLALDGPYSTDRYIQAIELAVAEGYDVLIIDSITHQWSGVGGILERKEQLDARGGNNFANWAKFTPETERFRNALLEAPIHLIACCRAKQEYVVDDGEGGRGKKVRKMGLKPDQREGLEYEFGIALQLQMDHKAEATKDRTDVFEGKIADLKSPKVGKALRAWLDSGATLKSETARPELKVVARSEGDASSENEIARASIPEKARAPEPSAEQSLESAKATPLMGKPESWDNHGGKALGDCPDKVLRAALRFFKEKLREKASPRMEEQCECIGLILANREANSEQLTLDNKPPEPAPSEEAGEAAEFPSALQDDVDDLPF